MKAAAGQSKYEQWKATSLQPIAEKLSAHPGQIYSGDMQKSRIQAAIRLLAHPNEQTSKFAEQFLA